MRKLIASVLAVFAVGAATIIVVTSDRGGNVSSFARYYADLHERGVRVEIKGYCASACTMALAYDNACVGPAAVLGFHSAYTYTFFWFGWKHHNQAATDLMWAHYPERVRAWITAHGGLKPDMIYLQGDALKALVKSC